MNSLPILNVGDTIEWSYNNGVGYYVVDGVNVLEENDDEGGIIFAWEYYLRGLHNQDEMTVYDFDKPRIRVLSKEEIMKIMMEA